MANIHNTGQIMPSEYSTDNGKTSQYSRKRKVPYDESLNSSSKKTIINDSSELPGSTSSLARDSESPSTREYQIYSYGCDVRFEWELPRVLAEMGEESSAFENLSRFVVLTGSAGSYECCTCGEYVKRKWGQIGTCALEALDLCYKRLQQSRDAGRYWSLFGLDVPPDFQCRPGLVTETYVDLSLFQWTCLERQRSKDALAWICKAVRANPCGQDSRKFYVSTAVEDPPSTPAGMTPTFLIKPLEPMAVEEIRSRNSCWFSLFRTGIIVREENERSWGKGLEIPFDMMTQLAAVQNYHPLADGTILLGYFTALIPTAVHPETGSVQWHFEVVEDEAPTDFLQPRQLTATSKDWFQTKDISILRQSRCYVGWCDHAHILLGTRMLLKESRMTWSSGFSERQQTAHRSGFEAGGQLAANAGPITIAAQGLNTWRFHSNIQRFSPSSHYIQALYLSSRKVALVIDGSSQRAWLVPMLSLVLHLCHRYFQEIFQDDEENPIPFVEPSADGAGAVIDSIKDHGDLTVLGQTGTTDRETLRQLFLRINTNLLEASRTREQASGTLFASELMDMVSQPGIGSTLKEVPLRKSMISWAPLTDTVDVIGVCGNLGQAIGPVVANRRDTDCACLKLPEQSYLLAAHTWCLEQIWRRVGSPVANTTAGARESVNLTSWRTNGVLCSPKCDHIASELEKRTRHDQTQLSNQSPEMASASPDGMNPTERSGDCRPDLGAVVFGLPRTSPPDSRRKWQLLKYLRPKRPERDMSQVEKLMLSSRTRQ